jgi:osmoprotectant transport system ATP-binding protein
MTGPLLAFDHVDVSYDGGRTSAVHDAVLDIPGGAFLALVGASGSGKTSLLKCINRLHEPTRGTVRFEGKPTNDLPAHELRRRIGYVFQGIGLFPHMTVAENISVTPRLLGWSDKAIAARVDELLDLVALPRDVATRLPRQLSGGQQQRVGIARALAAKPKLMVMDEPFGALDPVTRDGLGTAYRRLHDDLGLTTIMVTHDMQEAVLLSDRIVMLEQGRITADDSPRALMRSDDPGIAALMSVPRNQFARVAKLLGDPPHA